MNQKQKCTVNHSNYDNIGKVIIFQRHTLTIHSAYAMNNNNTYIMYCIVI